MTGTEMREILHEVGDGVAAPPVDQLAFQAEVRRERRQRTAGRIVVAGAAAACVGVVATVAAGLLPDPATRPASPASVSPSPDELGEVVWAVVDGRLVAWDGDSTTTLRPVEGLLGSTEKRVWAVDRESRIVSISVVDLSEGARPTDFRTGDSPTDEPVQSAALSDDGRYLAWVDLDESVTVYDLSADEVAWSVAASGASRYLADVAADGVLVSGQDQLRIHRPDGSTLRVPSNAGAPALESQLAPGRVLVTRYGGDSTLMSTDGSRVRELHRLPGTGVLSPDGKSVVTFTEEGTPPSLWDAEHGTRVFEEVRDVSVTAVRWMDDGSEAGVVLLTGSRDGTQRLFACDPVGVTCGELPVGPGDIRISR